MNRPRTLDEEFERFKALRDSGLDDYDAAAEMGISYEKRTRMERAYRLLRHIPPRRKFTLYRMD